MEFIYWIYISIFLRNICALTAWSAKGRNKQPEPTFTFCSIYDSPKQLLLAILQSRNFISVKISWTNILRCRLGQECVWVCGLLTGYSRSSKQRRMNQDEWAREKSGKCIKEVFTAAWKQYVGIELRNKEMDSWPHWRQWGFLHSVNNFGSVIKDGWYLFPKKITTNYANKLPHCLSSVPNSTGYHRPPEMWWPQDINSGAAEHLITSPFLFLHPASIVLPVMVLYNSSLFFLSNLPWFLTSFLRFLDACRKSSLFESLAKWIKCCKVYSRESAVPMGMKRQRR